MQTFPSHNTVHKYTRIYFSQCAYACTSIHCTCTYTIVNYAHSLKHTHTHVHQHTGTCINNTSVFMFKKGCFELGATIYPVVIKVTNYTTSWIAQFLYHVFFHGSFSAWVTQVVNTTQSLINTLFVSCQEEGGISLLTSLLTVSCHQAGLLGWKVSMLPGVQLSVTFWFYCDTAARWPFVLHRSLRLVS